MKYDHLGQQICASLESEFQGKSLHSLWQNVLAYTF